MLSETITLPVDGLDSVRPFSLMRTNVGGQAVRLERVLTTILEQHAYPPIISLYLAQVVTMAALLHGTFKHQGITTLQIKGTGAVDTILCDVTDKGHMRAYAQFDLEKLQVLGNEGSLDQARLIGEGYLLMVVDPEGAEERYQGIVELQEGNLIASFEHYFHQSAQLQTAIRIAVEPPLVADSPLQWRDSQTLERFGWRAGGVILQQTPATSLVEQDDWQAVRLILETLTHQELIDSSLPIDQLLYRLFHEFGVRVHETMGLQALCRCSTQKIIAILQEMWGKIEEEMEVQCEFCGKNYSIEPTKEAKQ